MGSKERAKERREKRLQEISLLRTIPYSDHQRWWSSETVAVVTGELGFEIARQLADHGLTVILTSRESSAGLEAANALKELGLSVDFHQLDVLDSLSIKKLAEWIEQTYGGIDVLVNNAGVNYNLGADNSVEHAQNVVATNYYGTKNVSQALIPLMRPSAVVLRLEDKDLREKLANLETLSEELIDRMVSTFLQQVEEGTYTSGGWPQMFTDYSVSKLAVNAFTRLMAKMLSDRPDGQKIYINCYCPGWVKTAMTGWAGNISAEDGLNRVFSTSRPTNNRKKKNINKMASLRRALVNVHRILCSTTTPNHISVSYARYSTLSNNVNENPSLGIELSNEESKRRLCNRLLYRSRQRGFLELDLVLGKWVEEHVYSMDENGVKALVDVLDLENPDLWKWLTGQEQPPEGVSINPVFSAVRDKIMNNLSSHASPETRAIPGQPWVRGWDDIKKNAGSPVAGNQ
uniref:Uncharacterized protein n=1 Tax=Salix viminalis TaxID=40686 RepID=A0A6N2MJJ8_SALVM